MSSSITPPAFLVDLCSDNNWKCPTVIAIFVYVILIVFAPVPQVLAAATFTSPPWIRILVHAIISDAEVYLMTLIVVFVIEDRV